MSDHTPLTREDLLSLFQKEGNAKELIGVEVEIAILDPETGLSIPYFGDQGMQGLLRAFVAAGLGSPIHEKGQIMGVQMVRGSMIALEHGGAIEYVSVPEVSLASLHDRMMQDLRKLAEIAGHQDLALVPGGMLPFNSPGNTNWVPKKKGILMREFFANLGDPGSGGQTVMAHTISTQATLDYVNETDFIEKLRASVKAGAPAIAIFANSPIEEGKACSALSRRVQHWFKTDPPRCGFLSPALEPGTSLEGLVDWALSLPMIYRAAGNDYQSGGDLTFAEIMERGFEDGSQPNIEHWFSHISQTFTDVRARHTIELRAADGPPFESIGCVPAFWVGLLYHQPSRRALLELLAEFSPHEHHVAREDAAQRALAARMGRFPIIDLAREMVLLAREGLLARVREGLEPMSVLRLLSPVEEIVATGKTFAERCLERWEGDLHRSPGSYVAAYRI